MQKDDTADIYKSLEDRHDHDDRFSLQNKKVTKTGLFVFVDNKTCFTHFIAISIWIMPNMNSKLNNCSRNPCLQLHYIYKFNDWGWWVNHANDFFQTHVTRCRPNRCLFISTVDGIKTLDEVTTFSRHPFSQKSQESSVITMSTKQACQSQSQTPHEIHWPRSSMW